MATKKRARPKTATQPLDRLRGSMRNLQRDAEKLLRRTQQRAGTLIQRDQRKALSRILSQAGKLRKDLEHRAQRAGKQLESRTETFFSAVEKDLRGRLHDFLKRLDVPSRNEVRQLSRRINELEKRLKRSGAASAGGAAPSSSPRPEF